MIDEDDKKPMPMSCEMLIGTIMYTTVAAFGFTFTLIISLAYVTMALSFRNLSFYQKIFTPERPALTVILVRTISIICLYSFIIALHCNAAPFADKQWKKFMKKLYAEQTTTTAS